MTRAPLVVMLAASACGGRAPPASRAGDDFDEGGGALARASMLLVLGDGVVGSDGAVGKDSAEAPDGGASYGGDAYGGVTYAGWSLAPWSYAVATHVAPYAPASNLTGAVEGTVTWQGAIPSAVMTTCGPIPNPTVRVASDRGVAGAIVYIEHLDIGRPMSPTGVGGIVAKRGCAFVPPAQIVSPLPTSVTVYGDATRAHIRVAGGGVGVKTYELQAAGRVELAANGGILKIESDDARVAAAWVLALDTPAYAITDDAGRFRIDELASGTYDMTFWQAPVASSGPDGAFAYGAPIVVHRRVRVDDTKVTRIDVALTAR